MAVRLAAPDGWPTASGMEPTAAPLPRSTMSTPAVQPFAPCRALHPTKAYRPSGEPLTATSTSCGWSDVERDGSDSPRTVRSVTARPPRAVGGDRFEGHHEPAAAARCRPVRADAGPATGWTGQHRLWAGVRADGRGPERPGRQVDKPIRRVGSDHHPRRIGQGAVDLEDGQTRCRRTRRLVTCPVRRSLGSASRRPRSATLRRSERSIAATSARRRRRRRGPWPGRRPRPARPAGRASPGAGAVPRAPTRSRQVG